MQIPRIVDDASVDSWLLSMQRLARKKDAAHNRLASGNRRQLERAVRVACSRRPKSEFQAEEFLYRAMLLSGFRCRRQFEITRRVRIGRMEFDVQDGRPDLICESLGVVLELKYQRRSDRKPRNPNDALEQADRYCHMLSNRTGMGFLEPIAAIFDWNSCTLYKFNRGPDRQGYHVYLQARI